ncbi:CocE/NonD family hydrolase [Oceanivirga salmonicida]|uniref:CocE/NonD family hydrolase n=1 Tax=Oceanivirga salmonicida TaxID=1769291 RepID=UPI0012E1A329|nr:CocE/NonD family hydrolase [Oceanivirga salmonicida]
MKKIKLFLLSFLLILVSCVYSNDGIINSTNNSMNKHMVVTGEILSKHLNAEIDNVLLKKELTNQELVRELLLWAGVKKDHISNYPDDSNSYAKSLGMTNDIENYNPTALSTKENLIKMLKVAKILHGSYHAKKKTPLFLNGMAQPIFPYTTGAVEKGYSNENSDIIRYIVYVETDYDTDGDGKLDLVKTLVQIPRAVMNGDYKAATIFDARPYVTGTTEQYSIDEIFPKGGSYDISKLYSKPKKRKIKGKISTQKLAKKAISSEWYYKSPYESTKDNPFYSYENLTWYDYYLVRGFAVVTSAGLGTRGSEGFETVGSDLEISAFKNIIEWLTGNRVAYTDKTSNIEIKADWSNGKVGMTGRSYSGTTPFGVARTGVKGLETIVPVAGIASYYEYMNSQGTPLADSPYDELNYLALYCAGRYIDKEDWNKISKNYGNYLHQLRKDQKKYGSNYSEVWENRDYTLNSDKIKVSALIVHGLNDYNVRTKQFELMFKTFKKQNQNVKLILHQGAHITPAYISHKYAVPINGEFYEDILNRWFSHYLYGVKNNVNNMPEVIAQSNENPDEWYEYVSWDTLNSLIIKAKSDKKKIIINSNYKKARINDKKREETLIKKSTTANATYVTNIDKDIMIKGSVLVSFKAALNKAKKTDNLPISVLLVDVAEKDFPVFNLEKDSVYVNKKTIKEKGVWIGSGVENLDLKQFKTTNAKYKVIAKGWINLANPESGFESITAKNSIVPKVGEYHNYNLYLQPNVYKIKAGHKLVLVITAYDSDLVENKNEYGISFNTNSITMKVPIVGESMEATAKYIPIKK